MKQKNKNIILVVLFVLVCPIIYRYTISKTITLRYKVTELNELFSDSEQRQLNISKLRNENYYLDSIISSNNVKFSSVQNQLLGILNQNSKRLNFKIISFKEPHEFVTEDKKKITSFSFKLEGNYKSLERILFIIENDYSLGRIVHTAFEIDENYQSNQKKLQVNTLISYINKETDTINTN